MIKNWAWLFICLLLGISNAQAKQFRKKQEPLKYNTSAFKIIENKGQWDSKINYRIDVSGGALFLENKAFTYHFYDAYTYEQMHHGAYSQSEFLTKNVDFHAYQVEFLGAQSPQIQAINPLSHYYNYFVGPKSSWQSNVKAYKKVLYQELYQGIDLLVYSGIADLKYDFVVHPKQNPNVIQLNYKGATSVELKNRNLLVKTAVGTIVEEKPYAYQIINNQEVAVPCEYVLTDTILSFAFPEGYNNNYDLIIDPVLVFSTYVGSSVGNFGYTATFDDVGHLYGAGSVFDVGYPTTLGVVQANHAGGSGSLLQGTDIGVTKFDSSGTFIIWSTYLGGSQDELPHSLVVDGNNDLYIFGTTGSSDFPTTANAYDPTWNGGQNLSLANIGVSFGQGTDIFVSKLNPTATQLVASTYFGGSNNDGLNTAPNLKYNYADEVRGEIILDRDENVIVATCTRSNNVPTTPGVFQPNFGGGAQDGIIFKFDPLLNNLLFSTYYGGSNNDAIYSIDVTQTNNFYVSGGTQSTDLTITPNAYQPTHAGGRCDGFVAYIDSSSVSILNSTYFGSDAYDQIYFVKLDRNDKPHILGQTEKTGSFFVSNANYFDIGGGQITAKFNTTLTATTWSTQWGSTPGQPNISPTAFLVDLCNAVYITGWGGGTNQGSGNNASFVTGLDVTPDALQQTPGDNTGSDFYILVIDDNANSLIYGSFFGGTAAEHVDGGTSRFDRKGRVYHAVCAGCLGGTFPTFPNPGAVSNTSGSVSGNTCNLGVFKINFNLPFVVADFLNTEPICVGDTFFFTNTSLTQGNSTYLWDFGDNTTSTDTNAFHVYANPGNYTVQLIINDPTSCNLSDTLTKQINVNSPLTITQTVTNFCLGDSILLGVNLSPDTSVSYQWVPTVGVSDSTASTTFITPTGNIDYYLVIDSVCPDTIVFPVDAPNSVIADFNLSSNFICEGNQINFTNSSQAQSSTSYLWNFGDGTTSTQVSPQHTYNQPGTYQVQLVVTDVTSCNGTDTLLQPVEIVNDTSFTLAPETICLGDSFQLYAPAPLPYTGLNYNWTPALNMADSNNVFTNVAPQQQTTYYLVNDVCNDTVSITISIDAIYNSFTTNDTILCSTTSVPFNITYFTGGTGTSFVWSNNSQFSDTLNNPLDSTANVLASNPINTWYVQATSNLGCIATDSVQATLADEAYLFNPNPVLCFGDTVRLGITNLNPLNILSFGWTQNPMIISPLNQDSVTVVAAQNDSLFVTINSSIPGCDAVKAFNVVVEQLAIDFVSDSVVCGDDIPATLVGTSFGTTSTFLWSTQNNFGDTLNSLTDSSFTTSLINPFTNFYFKTYTPHCELVDSIRVFLSNALVEPNSEQYICYKDEALVLVESLNPFEDLNYSWSPKQFITSRSDSSAATVLPDSTTYFVVEITNPDNGCITYDSVLVTTSLISFANFQVTVNDTFIFSSQQVDLEVTPTNFNVLWQPSIAVANATSHKTTGFPTITTWFIATIFDPLLPNCSRTDSVRVRVVPFECDERNLFIPNAFTPNGDGLNDEFQVIGAEPRTFELIIFNRWGEEIYSTKNIYDSWDGTYKGKPVEPEVYVYQVNATCYSSDFISITGNVTVLR